MAQIVVTGSLMQCTFGVTPVPINVLPINRVLINGRPAASITSNATIVNIPPFGLCSSPANPAVIAALGAPSACVPVTPSPWIVGSPTALGGNIPFLTTTSKLICAYGGLIQFVVPGQFTTMAD